MTDTLRAPQAAARASIDDSESERPGGEAPLLDIASGAARAGPGGTDSAGLHERLMGNARARHNQGQGRADARGESARGRGRGAVGEAREWAYELLFVKSDGAPYTRQYLRKPGQVIEGVLLCAIFVALAVSIMDSFNEFETNHPESHCWYHCCKHKSGRCSAEICEKHKDDANKTSPVDATCSAALFYKVTTS